MIWFTLALFAVSFFLSVLLAPKPKLENARAAGLDDVTFPKADAGSPIPYIFGRVRLYGPNTIWFGDFRTQAVTERVQTGLFSDEDVVRGYRYFLGLDLALCMGPGVLLHKIYVEEKVFFESVGGVTGDGTFFAALNTGFFGGPDQGGGFGGGFRFYSGEFTQTANAYLVTKIGPDVPGYVGTAHLVMENVEIGSSPNLRPMSFEVARYPNNLGLGASRIIGQDLNPMEILYSLLTEEWGGGDVDASNIDTASFTTAAATLLSEVHGMSLKVVSANDAKDAVTEILRQVDGVLRQDPTTGKIQVKLIRADYVAGTLPLFDESSVEFVSDWSHNDWSETLNQVRATFTERARAYSVSAAVVQDPANVAFQGGIKSTTVAFPGVTVGTLAVQLAARELSQHSIPLARGKLTMKRNASALRPGDPFRFSWAEFGLSEVVMRAQAPDLGELTAGRIVMPALQDRFAAGVPLFSAPESTGWTPLPTAAVTITDRDVIEAPYYMVSHYDGFITNFTIPPAFNFPADSSFMIAVARPPAASALTGYDVVTSNDGFTADVVHSISNVGFPKSAVLQVKVLPQQGIRAGNLTKVTIALQHPNDGVFVATSTTLIRTQGYNLMLVDGEIMAFETVTSLGGGVYELGVVRRALLDTQWGTHNVGTGVYLLDSPRWMTKDYRPDTSTIDVRLPSLTTRATQDLASTPNNQVVNNQRIDRPLAPDEITTVAIRAPQEIIEQGSISTSWTNRNRINPNTVVLVDDSANTPEASTTMNVRFLLNGVQLVQNSGVSSTPPSVLSGLDGVGLGRVEVEAIRGGLISFLPDFVEFWYGRYPSITAELLTNPGFEGTLTGWTTITGTWAFETTAFPLDAMRSVPGHTTGTRHLRSTGTTNRLRQDFTIGANSGRAALFSAWKGGKGTATGQVVVELRDASSALETISTPLVAATDVGAWERIEIPLPLRTDATIVRVDVVAPAAESVWDIISLRANTVTLTSTAAYDGRTGLTVRGAWGLRKMISTYSGALVRIRDTFDNSEFDVSADPDGNLRPFFTRGVPRVAKLYDQSGNTSHLVPVLGAPRFLNMQSETGRPAIQFEADTDLRDESAASTSRPYMTLRPCVLAAVGPKLGTSNTAIFTIPETDTSNTGTRWGLQTGSTDWRSALNNALNIYAGAGASNAIKSVHWIDYQNGNCYHNNDAAATDTFVAADVTYPNNTRLRLGDAAAGALDWTNGTLYELCIFDDSGIGAGDRQTLMEGVADFWFNLAV